MKVLGIAGLARAGKDTFCSIAIDILTKNGFKAKQYSFAEQLKKEVRPFLRDVCGADVWTLDPEIKKDIRDFLVWYGTTWWRKRDPKRWIRGVDVAMKNDIGQIDIALVSDVRYPNEGEWVRSWNGYLVHVSAWKWEADYLPDNRRFLGAPNEQERINDPLVKAQSDYKLEWPAKGLGPKEATEDPDLRQEVLRALNSCQWFSTPLTL